MENQRALAEELFGEALELPREQRSAFLDKACRDATGVRQLVEALLAKNDRLTGFLSKSPYQETLDVPAMRLASGAHVGRYTIIDELGSGGMGVVYRAHDETLGRVVALKMVSRAVLTTEEIRRHFRREAKALAKLNHPRIASVYDAGEQDGADFLVMELVEGQSLATKLRAGPLPVDEATAIARQIAEALGEAHEHGVIHRDLKPSNVMITPKGDVKVLDFGLAKLLAADGNVAVSVAETQGLLGTPAYMSPEQALGKNVDARTDLWGLGVLYFESLAGKPPFTGKNTLEVLHAITAAPLPSIRAIRPDLAILAEHILNRSLEKDRDLRYQRAAEIETDLKRLARDLDPERAFAGMLSVAPTEKIAPRKGALRWPKFAVASGLLVLLSLAYLVRPTVPPPRVIAIRQITHDGKRKMYMEGYRVQSSMVTDGLRIYFQELDVDGLRQISDGGGESASVPIPFNLVALVGLSPAKSELLLLGPPGDTSTTDSGGLWTMPVLGGQVRRIGNMVAFDATWSPDGDSIYYAEGSDIWAARSDGTGAKKILTTNGDPNWIRFSPDGKLFRFGVRNDKLNTNSLWEARADGGNLRRLFSGDAWPNECCGAWTSDGRYFVFESMRGGSWNLWATREKRDWWRRTNAEPVKLAAGASIVQSPLPSRNGSSVYFMGITKRGELERFDVKKRSIALYLPGLSVESLSFSRDGSRIAYISLPEGDLWQSKSDGSDRRQLTFAPLKAASAQWSPDGKQIVFVGHVPGKVGKIYIVPVDGGNPEQLIAEEKAEADPTWSPEGDAIVFGVDYGTALSSKEHPIQILNLKSGKITELPNSGRYFSPRWSPDGHWIAALDPQSSALNIFNVSTQKWEDLPKSSGEYPQWSRNSQCIYFIGNLTKEYRTCLADRRAEVVEDFKDIGPTESVFGGWGGITPDGSVLAVRDTSIEEIYSLELELP